MESSDRYQGPRRDVTDAEREKWAQYYSSLNDEESLESAHFGEELRAYVDQLLPGGGRVLEAGCGAGWQSLALARSGKLDVHLMDFAKPALDAAKRVFHSAGMEGTFVLGDAFQSGEPEYDLVFNAGVIEHYALDEQIKLLRAMASRSRKYVICVAPNRGCYWYWVSRVQNTAAGNWPFGKESPTVDFQDVFKAAGLKLVRQDYLGRAWTEVFIKNLTGLSGDIRDILLECHRSPVIEPEQSCYLIAGVGLIGEYPTETTGQMAERHSIGELNGALAENLARRIEAERELSSVHKQLLQLRTATDRFSEAFDHALETFRSQRAWKMMLAIGRAYSMVMREGWRGRFRLLFGPRPALDEFELQFPLLRRYLPPPAKLPSENTITGGAPRRYDVIVLAIIDFDQRFQRPQQIAAQFARNGHRVFWVSPTRVVPPTSSAPYHVTPLRDNLWEVHVRGGFLEPYSWVPSDYAVSQFCSDLRQLYRDYGLAETVIVAQLPFWRRFALNLRREPSSAIVYDCMDDWDTFENLGEFNRTEEPLLAGECDLLVVTAAKLREKFAARGIDSELIRNGADFDFFEQAAPRSELAELARPVVGYFGAIADWIDLDLVCAVARNRPSYSFVLVGQVFGRDTSALERLPNVRLLGGRPYEQMPSLVASFDVCIIPFLLNQVTHATDPVKLYEYLSQGKPVVSTDMSELRPLGELIYLADGAASFAERLDAAASESAPDLRARRIEFARTNSWSSRVQHLDRAIRQKFPKVSVLIVTYNSGEFIGPCLRSVERNTSYPNLEVIVVDNASTDESASLAESYARNDSRVRVMRLAENRGFAGGNNAAAAVATGTYVIFLNADTLVTPGWVGYLLRHVIEDPGIGLVCPVTNFAGNEAKINVEYTGEQDMEEFATRLAREKRGSVFDVAAVPLYCALMRHDLFQQVGGLDAGYQVGMFEDDDLSNAIRARGLRTCVADDCFVHHFGQGSFAALSRKTYDRIFSENRRRFEDKWKRTWVPHKTRPSVKPIHEEHRFTPGSFCRPAGGRVL